MEYHHGAEAEYVRVDGRLKMPVNSGVSWLVRLKLDVKSDLEDARPEVIQTEGLR